MWPSAIVVLVFGIILVANPQSGDGWFWEIGNGIGFLALGLLLALMLNGRSRLGHSQDHRWLGLAVFATVLVHILWFLIGDKVSWEYLKWGAPHYMVAGLMSAGMLFLVTLSSLVFLRRFSYVGHKPFRRWHSWLSILALITALMHVILSGFYVTYHWQTAVIIGLATATFYSPKLINLQSSFVRRNLVIVSILSLAVFSLIRMSSVL